MQKQPKTELYKADFIDGVAHVVLITAYGSAIAILDGGEGGDDDDFSSNLVVKSSPV